MAICDICRSTSVCHWHYEICFNILRYLHSLIHCGNWSLEMMAECIVGFFFMQLCHLRLIIDWINFRVTDCMQSRGYFSCICYTPAQRSWRGVYWIHLVRPSVCPSVCRRHGFRSISQVCWAMSLSKWPPGGHIGFFGFRTLTLLWLWISTSNFSGTILMYMGRCLLIFSNVIFKMAAWRPY